MAVRNPGVCCGLNDLLTSSSFYGILRFIGSSKAADSIIHNCLFREGEMIIMDEKEILTTEPVEETPAQAAPTAEPAAETPAQAAPAAQPVI